MNKKPFANLNWHLLRLGEKSTFLRRLGEAIILCIKSPHDFTRAELAQIRERCVELTESLTALYRSAKESRNCGATLSAENLELVAHLETLLDALKELLSCFVSEEQRIILEGLSSARVLLAEDDAKKFLGGYAATCRKLHSTLERARQDLLLVAETSGQLKQRALLSERAADALLLGAGEVECEASLLFTLLSEAFAELADEMDFWVAVLKQDFGHLNTIKKTLASKREILAKIASAEAAFAERKRSLHRNLRISKPEFKPDRRYAKLMHDYEALLDSTETIGQILSRSEKQDAKVLMPLEPSCIEAFDKLFELCMSYSVLTNERLAHIADLLTAKIQSISEPPSLSLIERSKHVMAELLNLLDCALRLQICISQEKNYRDFMRQQIYKRVGSSAADRQQLIELHHLRVAALNAHLEKTSALIEDLQEKRKMLFVALDKISAAPMVNYRYEQVLKNKQSAILGLCIEPDSESLNSTLENFRVPIERACKLLQRLEELILTSKADPIFSNASRTENSLGAERECVRNTLVELIEAEESIHNVISENVRYSKEKANVWESRINLAEKKDDEYMKLLAEKQKKLHEAAFEKLDKALSIHSLSEMELPAFISEALSAVERIERKCGLVPKELMRKNKPVLCLSLLDRLLLLIEKLDQLLEEEERPE